jgi:hypothetical protein
MLLASPPGGSRPIRPFSATPIMANVRAGRLLKIPAEPSPELRIPGAAAQTRAVSVAGIRLGSGESARGFKGIICDDISEFESHMPSHAVASLRARQASWIELRFKSPLGPRAPLRRNGARPCHLAQARAHDGWRRDGDERAGQGLGVHGPPAGRCIKQIVSIEPADPDCVRRVYWPPRPIDPVGAMARGRWRLRLARRKGG